MSNENIKQTVNLIMNSNKIFALTGAGISTESGIPDFRSTDGYYSKMDPMLALSKDTLLNNPKRFYKEGYVILEDLNNKEPNRGHFVLKELENMGYLSGIITQNIDNLHTKAGSKNVYEVHGHTRGVHCLECYKNYNFEFMKSQVETGKIPPRCECGGILRPDVILFGDMMPDTFVKASNELYTTDLLIVIGSSLTVSPVNYLPKYVKNLIIINNSSTPYDNVANFIFNDNASDVLESILEELKSRI